MIENSNGDDDIGKSRFECFQGEVIHGLRIGNSRQSVSAGRVADNRNPAEPAGQLQSLDAVFESAFVEKPVTRLPTGTVLLG